MNVELNSGIGSPQAVVPSTVLKPVATETAKGKAESSESVSTQAQKSSQNNEERLKEAAEKINDFIASITTDLRFTIDKDTDRVVVKVISHKTGEVIRQIPSEETLKLAKALDSLKGLIIQEKA
ncbi:flagellar protein FlaG [Geotalea uraniireducens]|uniref:Flagellar protein FlaG n=1 Tax=Geotalea uraniireducens TaxID=351604 RepID=A0ABM8EQ88_9BACT|nr:flagellar protein FlaG [Geotalea uraniireducens]BDV44416.1 flagellar protein FlaG [Geotalea uraniireducens]